MSRRDAGITLVEVAAAVTLLGIVVALIVPSIARSSRFQKVLACVTGAGTRRCHYLGPVAEPFKLEAKDPLGCDLEDNHSDDGKEGGNVLLKSGEVVTDRTGLWNSAARQGKCRP